MTLQSTLILAVASLATTVASAAIGPSFLLEYSMLKATHIVLATEGDVIDGRLSVIDSWKGDLEQGEEVVIKDLREFADEKSRTVEWWQATHLPEPYVRMVTGQEMVLFLVKPEPDDRSAKQRAWLHASRNDSDGFKVSVAWLENGEAYVYRRDFNPGPTLLQRASTSLEMKASVASLVAIQPSLEEAKFARNPLLASQALRAFARENLPYGAIASIEALGDMGDAALPILRRTLNDPTLFNFHPNLVNAMVTAGGENIGPDLTEIIDKEFEFWEGQALDLVDGWWDRTTPHHEWHWLIRRYSTLLATLKAIEPLRYESCRNSVEKTQDLWTRIPALYGKGDGQIAQECKKVLQNLANASETP